MLLLSNNCWKCDENKPWWAERGLDSSASARAPGLIRAYREVGAEIMALQEVSRTMEALFIDALRPDGYELVTGGDTPILYRIDKLKLLESGFVRFPEEVPGLEGSFNNHETKSCTWGVFETRDEAKSRLAAMSVHLWWMTEAQQSGSDAAREWQFRQAAARIADAMGRYNCPGFISGDFNARMDSPCLMAAKEGGWTDVHDLAAESDETKGTHPCGPDGFAPRDTSVGFERAIDHILAKGVDPASVKSFSRLIDPWFDPLSDHYPCWCEFTF
jgi:endonuclease/exonuclease/phosphatase family metal-dependent hydrolase